MENPKIHQPAKPAAEAPALAVALQRNKNVKVRVEDAAGELATAGTVLKREIAGGATKVAAEAALDVSARVESKVKECADDLHDVNETLAQGVADLARTEKALASTQQTLAKTEHALVVAREGELEARQEAQHDAATGLPNRAHFNSRLTHDIAVAARHGFKLAVMFFDLDKFKSVNDSHGHAAGDEVLKQVAARLLGHCRSEDTVCRTGGDEFLYLLMNPRERRDIERIAASLLKKLTQPVEFGDLRLTFDASIGIALYPDDGGTAEKLIANADAAMYRTKTNTGGPAWFFRNEVECDRVSA